MGKRRQAFQELQYHTGNGHYPATQLPFYSEGDNNRGHYWSLPAVGLGWGTKEAGKAMAHAYLKHVAESGDHTSLLPYIVFDTQARIAAAKGAQEREILCSQTRGFFGEICRFIRETIRENPEVARKFRQMTRRSILDRANDGLQWTPDRDRTG